MHMALTIYMLLYYTYDDSNILTKTMLWTEFNKDLY